MHAHQMSLNQCHYQSRALSASPSPPPIPPQPNDIQYKQQHAFTSFDIPPPPPRCYQLISIRDKDDATLAPSPKMQSFGTASFGRSSLNRNNYENIRDIVKPPFLVKDPRRKPYYYNELNQSVDVDLNDQIETSNKIQSGEQTLNDEINRISTISENSMTHYSSGGSLNHII